jgi:hypothetical protein
MTFQTDSSMLSLIKDKLRFTKHYIENKKSTNVNPTKTGVKADTPEGLSVPAPHKAPVVLLLDDTNIHLS